MRDRSRDMLIGRGEETVMDGERAGGRPSWGDGDAGGDDDETERGDNKRGYWVDGPASASE